MTTIEALEVLTQAVGSGERWLENHNAFKDSTDCILSFESDKDKLLQEGKDILELLNVVVISSILREFVKAARKFIEVADHLGNDDDEDFRISYPAYRVCIALDNTFSSIFDEIRKKDFSLHLNFNAYRVFDLYDIGTAMCVLISSMDETNVWLMGFSMDWPLSR